MSPILATLTSRSDSNFERSNISLKENKRNGVDPISNGLECCVRKNEGKIYGFRQTELVLHGATFFATCPAMDDYAKDGGPGEV